MNKEEYIEYIEGYTSDADYEGLHMHLEINPDLIKDTYPLFEKLMKENPSLSATQVANRVLEEELAWTYE